jgi:hypothetical protein
MPNYPSVRLFISSWLGGPVIRAPLVTMCIRDPCRRCVAVRSGVMAVQSGGGGLTVQLGGMGAAHAPAGQVPFQPPDADSACRSAVWRHCAAAASLFLGWLGIDWRRGAAA